MSKTNQTRHQLMIGWPVAALLHHRKTISHVGVNNHHCHTPRQYRRLPVERTVHGTTVAPFPTPSPRQQTAAAGTAEMTPCAAQVVRPRRLSFGSLYCWAVPAKVARLGGGGQDWTVRQQRRGARCGWRSEARGNLSIKKVMFMKVLTNGKRLTKVLVWGTICSHK